MIRIIDNVFVIDTKNTTYVFRVNDDNILEHLYYGSTITIENSKDADCLIRQCVMAPGNTILYDENGTAMEICRLEISTNGKGDVRSPFIELTHSDGSRTSDFKFKEAVILSSKMEYKTLPTAYLNDDMSDKSSLEISLVDENYNLELKVIYSCFYDEDVITRQNVLVNNSDCVVKINKIMSMQLDVENDDYRFSTFTGAWAREMNRNDTLIKSGRLINSSSTGTSSNRANPFVMLSRTDTTEDLGICYGFNLIYSGNHYESIEVNSFNDIRFMAGINPEFFEYSLDGGEMFETPEAVMTFSLKGFNGMSQNMHEFVREHIVRGKWKKKDRPILLNSWEANYFDINEHKLLNLAKKASEVGIELFVMDDGWFGERNDDSKSLGDWDADLNKLPNGVKGLVQKINSLGLDFGIWVEPEMVNENSNLYKKHPEWVIKNVNSPHSVGRNQMILDLTNPVVQNYLIDKMTEVFSQGNIAYVKWDMNRIFSDYFSPTLSIDKMGELAHRYVVGLYKVMGELVNRFPDILFEGCASGGNRFDLGILCYFPQIWASDNTDALCRVTIQNGLSYGYPMSVIGAHVSGVPNHQTLRVTPIETRFNVASFGVLGYECNLLDLSKEDIAAIKEQIKFYKEKRTLMQWGTFYRGRSFGDNINSNVTEWTVVSKDKNNAITMIVQNMVVPNSPLRKIYVKGLDNSIKYTLTNRRLKYSIKAFGDLINTISPVHIKQNSTVHNVIDKIYKMDGEIENITGFGNTFSMAGINLKQSFAGTGFGEGVAVFKDYDSRIYLIDSVHE